jgi:hypothetical protein
MGLFSFIEIFFFISLGVTILLIALLVYHFKQRITSLEQKYDSLFDIVSNVVKQLRNIQALSTGNTSGREDALFREPSVSQDLPSLYLGNSSISTNQINNNSTISPIDQYPPHIFHQLIDPSAESSRFIIDYDSQFIREAPNVRDTASSEEDSDSGSDSDSDIESESGSESGSDTESEISDTKNSKILVSDDDKSIVDITNHSHDVSREVSREQLSNEVEDVRIITLPSILENVQDELNVHEIELHTEELAIESHEESISIIKETENEIDPHLNNFNTSAYIVQKVDSDEIDQPAFNEPSTIGKELYKKMTLPNLKATVIAKGLCSDPSKMKKSDLLKLLEEE